MPSPVSQGRCCEIHPPSDDSLSTSPGTGGHGRAARSSALRRHVDPCWVIRRRVVSRRVFVCCEECVCVLPASIFAGQVWVSFKRVIAVIRERERKMRIYGNNGVV
ncbi:hypothetical protein BaRGS_00013680 [Batillaria attramentaria]|uniref:Uncharacterized protein n=1 Tax=Batillaria attramentaria TaxID=370345 RepID=A0ABD0L7C0_9CAEN